jgi:hypothetical protein
MNNAEYNALNDFNAGWRVRAREADAREASLSARLADLERREAEAIAADAARKAKAAPATAEELTALDSARRVQWIHASLARHGINFDNLSGHDSEFESALRSVPTEGWPDLRETKEHLADLRSGADVAPEVIEPEAPVDDSGLARMLRGLR